jgi:cytochrome c oxidase subunit 3
MPGSSAASSPFEGDIGQRKTAAELGMWLFLATEVLFFGGLLVSYAVYRTLYPQEFAAAARHTEIALGTINTAILLLSSFTIAVAVKTQTTARILSRALMLVTVALGAAFLCVKGWEYWIDIREGLVPGPHFALPSRIGQIVFSLYWLMTGVHALHVTVGMGVLLMLHRSLKLGRIDPERSAALDVGALYWHLVDMIWIFLYPMLYLVGRNS